MTAIGAPRPALIDGLFFIVIAAFALSLGDGLVKITSTHASLWQLLMLRSLIAVPLLIGVIRTRGGRSLKPNNSLWVGVRSLLLVAMWIAVYVAVASLPLPTVSAALYTAPLIITLLSGLAPGRRLAAGEIGAVVVGFVGVLMLLQPGGSAFSVVLWLPLAGALCYALAALVTGSRCREESPLLLSLILNVAFLLVGTIMTTGLTLWPVAAELRGAAPFVLNGWQTITSTALLPVAGLVTMLALIMVVANTSMARAYQIGPAPVIAAGDYSYLVFSCLWSLLLFGEAPTALGALGIALIVAAGLWASAAGRGRSG